MGYHGVPLVSYNWHTSSIRSTKIQVSILALKETVFVYWLFMWFVAQSFVLPPSFNSHLDIWVEVGRNACVVWDGVGGWVLRNNDCRHLPWCKPKHIAVLRNHALPRDSASLRPGRWLVFTTQFYLCARIEQTLVQREPVNFILGQQVKTNNSDK